MYSTTRYGRVYLSNIKLSETQTSKYHWNIQSLPAHFDENSNVLVENHSMDDIIEETNIPNCSPTNAYFISVNNTIKSAAYFALFGLLGFSIVWLFLILCLIYDNVCFF